MRKNWLWDKRTYSAKSGEWTQGKKKTKVKRKPTPDVKAGLEERWKSYGSSYKPQARVAKATSYKGHKIFAVDDGWKTSLDPESTFDSEKDVKNFIKGWKGNPFRRRKNSPEEAESLAEGFHGRKPLDEYLITESQEYSGKQAVIGLLEELEIASADGMCYTPITFKHDDHRSAFAKNGSIKDTVFVTFPNRNQIEFIGGDQELPIEDMVDDPSKVLTMIGPVYGITYWTDKHHLQDGTGFSSYHHEFGEESVKFRKKDKPTQDEMLKRMAFMPQLVYDRVNRKCLLVGGVYQVMDEGITN
jgi:hypothetical protein